MQLVMPRELSTWLSSMPGLDVVEYTCLYFTIFSQVVELLLKMQASTNIPDNRGCFPLHLAAWRGNAEICRILLTQGPSTAKVNAQVTDVHFLLIIDVDCKNKTSALLRCLSYESNSYFLQEMS